MLLHKQIASLLGIGYLKGGGTIAAIVYAIIWYFLPEVFAVLYWQFVIVLIVVLVGTWSANVVEKEWGKDSSKVVIDEVAGMAITLLFLPQRYVYLVIGILLFRFFDIRKPLGIRSMEQLPGGVGVMADDILAGIYSLAILQLLMYCQKLFGQA